MDSKKMSPGQKLTPEQQLQIEHDLALSEALIRIQALETLLIRRGLLSQEEIHAEVKYVADAIMASVASAQKPVFDINDIINEVSQPKKPDPNTSN
jgi:hypothetical protein